MLEIGDRYGQIDVLAGMAKTMVLMKQLAKVCECKVCASLKCDSVAWLGQQFKPVIGIQNNPFRPHGSYIQYAVFPQHSPKFPQNSHELSHSKLYIGLPIYQNGTISFPFDILHPYMWSILFGGFSVGEMWKNMEIIIILLINVLYYNWF